MVDNTLSGTICLSCFCAFSNIYHKLNFVAKIKKSGPDLCNFYRKLNVWIFLSENIFGFSSLVLNHLRADVSIQYCESLRNFEQVEHVENLCPINITYICIDSCIICSHIYYEKKRKI